MVKGNHLKVKHITASHVSSYFNIYPRSKNKFFGKVSDANFIFIVRKNGKMGFTLIEGGQKLWALKVL